MTQRRSMPSRYAIVQYWQDQPGWDMLTWASPFCWACLMSVEYRDSDKRAVEWNSAGGLERAHIVPRSLGGTNDPENLFLLCGHCHDHAPCGTDRELFLRWVEEKQRQYEEDREEIRQALRMVVPGPHKDEFCIWLTSLQRTEIFAIWEGKVGIHGTSRGPRLSRLSGISELYKAFVAERDAGQTGDDGSVDCIP